MNDHKQLSCAFLAGAIIAGTTARILNLNVFEKFISVWTEGIK